MPRTTAANTPDKVEGTVADAFEISPEGWYVERVHAAPASPRIGRSHDWTTLPLFLIALIAVVTTIGLVKLSSSDSASASAAEGAPEATDSALDDVVLDSCTIDDFGFVMAGGEVVNHSSHPSDYLITVGFEDETGEQFSEGYHAVKALAPGSTQPWTINSVSKAPKGMSGRCVFVDVERLAS
jgi:hypothetical protein